MNTEEEIQAHYQKMFEPYLAGLIKLTVGLVKTNDRLGMLLLGKAVDQLFQAAVERLPDEAIDVANYN